MLIEAGKYYTIINAIKGIDEEYSEIEYYFGKFLLNKKSAVLKQFIDHEYKKINIVLENISSNAIENADERISGTGKQDLADSEKCDRRNKESLSGWGMTGQIQIIQDIWTFQDP